MVKELLPETPGRGRSRFSKALPIPPQPPHLSIKGEPSPTTASISTSLHSPLPPLPTDKMSTMAIPRRPVGGTTIHTKVSSVDSVSSVYSNSPGFSRSLSNSTKESFSGVDSESPSTPPLPPKDPQRPQLPKSPKPLQASPISNFQASSPRPELWRRRSLKSDKGISVSELKLSKSNGSTASPPQNQLFERSLPPVPMQLPRSITGRKPVPIPVRAAPPQPDSMGSKLSKLKDKEKRGPSDAVRHVAPVQQQQPSSNRLPTPEYLKTDGPQSLLPQVLSPTSPETPPSENAPQVPLKSDSRAALNVGPMANTTNLLTTKSHSRESSETLTVTSERPIMRSPQPQKTFVARILTPQPSPSTTPDASPLELPSPIRPNIKFPTLHSIVPEGTAFPAPPLNIVHFECYQSHKSMRSSRNSICPIACMVCQRQDAEKRWKCTWCCMSACGSCMDVLVAIPGRDLKICLERIEKQR